MPDERGTVTEDATLVEIRTLRGEIRAFQDIVERRFDSLTERVARLEGLVEGFKLAFDQMDKRANTMQWMIGLLVASQVLVLGKLFLK